MASAHKSMNGIHSIRMGGVRVENEELIMDHVEDYFQALFHEDRPLRPKVDGLQFPQLGEG